MSWQTQKQLASDCYKSKDYDGAIHHFSSALELLPKHGIHNIDRQRLLSNVILCHLTKDEDDNSEHNVRASASKEDLLKMAKECVSLNSQWPKSHYRLAQVYLNKFDRSNDACNCLQRALQLDPRFVEARQLLMRQLRTRDRGQNSADVDNSCGGGLDDGDNDNGDDDGGVARDNSSNTFDNRNDRDYGAANGIDEMSSIYENVVHFCNRVLMEVRLLHDRTSHWFYHEISDERRGFVILGILFFILLIGFGGISSFFSNTSGRQYRGNYDDNNVYNSYRNQAAHQRRPYYSETGPSAGYYQSSYQDYSRTHQRGYSDSYSHRGNDGYHMGGTLFSNFTLFDGSGLSMVILLLIMYIANKMGISPFQIYWALRLMGGHGFNRRRGFRGRGRGFW
mmetsp:Transcript_19731/g.25585  ORF Transcript_19731/g.25585 Transcript_19731/m.25585 type:complete len:394 (-) Transcript_19731:522-1703(-)